MFILLSRSAYIAFIAVAVLSAHSAHGAAQKALLIKQKQYISGNQVILVCPLGIKLINTTQNYEVISKAPKWDVDVFRRDDKVSCHYTLEEFFKQHEYHAKALPKELHPVATQTLGVLHPTVFRSPKQEFWIAKTPLVPYQARDLLSAYYKCNRLDGLLIKFTTTIGPGEKKSGLPLMPGVNRPLVMVETYECSETPFKTSDFEAPIGYKTVASSQELMTSKSSRKQAAEIFQEMGLGEDFGSSKSK